MSTLTTLEKIDLRNFPNIDEKKIQEYIYKNPDILGLSKNSIVALTREKPQPTGGFIDILLADENDDTRYEVEIQLGKTDPSHIIRTIEYWDIEKKRYPNKDHCAVIVAEDITGRFMNVISLFNGAIPLIAIQMNAFKNGDDVVLTFTKVLDRVEYADEVVNEETDRNYWEKLAGDKTMKLVDKLYKSLPIVNEDSELKYNKFYIGLYVNGMARNYISMSPKKRFMYLFVKITNDVDVSKIKLECDYIDRDKSYRIRIESEKEIENNIDAITELVTCAKKNYFG